jgi:hypothetical protein
MLIVTDGMAWQISPSQRNVEGLQDTQIAEIMQIAEIIINASSMDTGQLLCATHGGGLCYNASHRCCV